MYEIYVKLSIINALLITTTSKVLIVEKQKFCQ